MRLALLPLLCLAPACLALACAHLRSAPEEVHQDIHSYAEPNRARVTHVALDLLLDFDAKEARGTAALTLERRDPQAPLVLDTKALIVQEVTGVNGTTRQWHLGPDDEKLGQALIVTLADGDREVRVRYKTTASSEAMQWLAPEQTADGDRPFLFTQGESILTRRTDPCGSSTCLPSVAAMVPPPPIRMPARAPLKPPRMPPMIAPTPAPAAVRPASPLMPSPSIACVTVPRSGYARPLTVT